jgi:hypothetical protein
MRQIMLNKISALLLYFNNSCQTCTAVYILQGEVREALAHSIAPVKDTGYPMTLRKLRT